VIDDRCYDALRQCTLPGKEDVFADFADLITALHTGQLEMTKDGDQPQEVYEIINALEESIGIDEFHLIHWPYFQALEGVKGAGAIKDLSVEAVHGEGCLKYLLQFVDLSSCADEGLLKDASYIVPPGDKWPLNNGFIRILPLLEFARVIFPQPGDVAVYTTGYVVEKDKLGFTRGQACHAALVVEVESGSSDAKGSIIVQSKPVRLSAQAVRHPLKTVPAHLFKVPGGGPFCYFYRKIAAT